jgi:hypothetical protein
MPPSPWGKVASLIFRPGYGQCGRTCDKFLNLNSRFTGSWYHIFVFPWKGCMLLWLFRAPPRARFVRNIEDLSRPSRPGTKRELKTRALHRINRLVFQESRPLRHSMAICRTIPSFRVRGQSAHIAPSNACHRAAPETTVMEIVPKISLSLSLGPGRRPYTAVNL